MNTEELKPGLYFSSNDISGYESIKLIYVISSKYEKIENSFVNWEGHVYTFFDFDEKRCFIFNGSLINPEKLSLITDEKIINNAKKVMKNVFKEHNERFTNQYEALKEI